MGRVIQMKPTIHDLSKEETERVLEKALREVVSAFIHLDYPENDLEEIVDRCCPYNDLSEALRKMAVRSAENHQYRECNPEPVGSWEFYRNYRKWLEEQS